MSKAREKLCKAAVELFAEKGYENATTKEIATSAGVSEMTLFRQFGTKEELFRCAFMKYVYEPTLGALFDHELQYELETDLCKVASLHYALLEQNEKIILTTVRSTGDLADYSSPLRQMPEQLLYEMSEYLGEMQRRGKVREGDAVQQAAGLTSIVIGTYAMRHFLKDELVSRISLSESVRSYCSGLRK